MAGENAFYRIGDLDPDLMRFLNDIENEFPKTGAYEIDIEIYRNLGVLYLDIIPGLTSRYERGEISINEAYKIIDDKKERTREMIPTDAPFMVKLKIRIMKMH